MTSNINANVSEKRKTFRKCIETHKLDSNNRLCIINNNIIKNKENNIYFKIPYKHEKDIIINDCHANYNHCGRDNTYENILNCNWYWQGMKKDIEKILSSYALFAIQEINLSN